MISGWLMPIFKAPTIIEAELQLPKVTIETH